MDAQFAIVGKSFAISVTDKGVAHSIVKMKHNADKTCELTPHTLMSVTGVPGDTSNFSEYIQGNVRLYGIRNSQNLSPSETASFIRGELANSLRTRRPRQVNLLVMGYDKNTNESSLYWIDYLSAIAKVPFAAHGHCSYFVLSVMDREYKPDITLEQGFDIIKKCIAAVKMRFPINFTDYTIKVVDSDGVREVSMADI
ncbi:Proteasome subunit beta type-4 [Coemansia sp. RSA 1365]|nr:Proteasome subunit beta type-4 [Coemansia sp. RSA 1365]